MMTPLPMTLSTELQQWWISLFPFLLLLDLSVPCMSRWHECHDDVTSHDNITLIYICTHEVTQELLDGFLWNLIWIYDIGDYSIFIVFNFVQPVIPMWWMLKFMRWDQGDTITIITWTCTVMSLHCYDYDLGYHCFLYYHCCICFHLAAMTMLSSLMSIRTLAETQEWLDRCLWNLVWT